MIIPSGVKVPFAKLGSTFHWAELWSKKSYRPTDRPSIHPPGKSNQFTFVFPGNPRAGYPDDQSWWIHNNDLPDFQTKVPSSASFLLLSSLPVPQQVCRPSIKEEAASRKHPTANPKACNCHLEARKGECWLAREVEGEPICWWSHKPGFQHCCV